MNNFKIFHFGKTKIPSLLIVGFVLVLFSGCQDQILQEQPRSQLVPSYYETADGVRGALIGAYSDMRNFYGSEWGFSSSVLGTDIYEGAAFAESESVAFDDYLATLNPANSIVSNLWSNPLRIINTTNGVIEHGNSNEELAEDEKARIVAEAKFLRAFHYFKMVRHFGGVPLDLGSGELNFNLNPSTESTRNSVSEVYDAIIQDLQDAMNDLPNEALEPGRADKAASMHLLSKVYLTRGWLEDESQPDDFFNAFDLAKELIDDRSSYGLDLEQYFSDVNAPENEHGPESIWTSERTTNINFVGGLRYEGANAWNKFVNPSYGSQLVTKDDVTVNPVSGSYLYNSGWNRFKPTQHYLQEMNPLDNRDNDSRFEANFRTVWYANTAAAAPVFAIGDTAFYMPGHEVSQADRDAVNYRIYAPSDYSDRMFPQLKLYDDPNRPQPGDASTRPVIIYRFSETYLIAAEAALQDGRPADAVPYLNAIRERAANRKDNSDAENQLAAVNMTITAGDVNIDLILDERAREFPATALRWFDLVRTNTLADRLQMANTAGAQNIQEHHELRPIPQNQIDLLTGGDKDNYQNPGY